MSIWWSKKICITFSSHFYHNIIKLFLRHFPEIVKIYFLQHCYKNVMKMFKYFFDSITYSWHFYDNLTKMLEIPEFVMNMTMWKKKINFALIFYLRVLKNNLQNLTMTMKMGEHFNRNYQRKLITILHKRDGNVMS